MSILSEYLLKLWWGGDPDVKDPVSGMSTRDVYNVQTSWANIYADAQGNGFLIFTRLFEACPETKSFFPYISSTSEEQMSTSVTFQAHIIYIMSSLNTAVCNLTRPEIVVPIMIKLGKTHQRQHIRRRHFRVFEQVLLNILKTDLHFNEEMVSSWTLFIAFMYKHIFTVVEQ